MRIILADQHVQPCLALRTMLEQQPEFYFIGEAADAQSLLELAQQYHPDLVLVDSELPGLYIEDLIFRLHALEPSLFVVVMSSNTENSRKLLQAGADAFASKADDPEWLLETLIKFKGHSKRNELG